MSEFPRQGNGGPDGRPLCFNGQTPENYLVQDGWHPGVLPDGTPTRYPVMRYAPNRFSRGCKSWVSDPSTDPVPLIEGWKCEGCQHYPAEVVAEAVIRSMTRD